LDSKARRKRGENLPKEKKKTNASGPTWERIMQNGRFGVAFKETRGNFSSTGAWDTYGSGGSSGVNWKAQPSPKQENGRRAKQITKSQGRRGKFFSRRKKEKRHLYPTTESV